MNKLTDIDWNNPFKPEDFDYADAIGCVEAVYRANARFQELLETAPKIKGYKVPNEVFGDFWVWGGDQPTKYDTYTAHIVKVEKMK